MPTAFISYASQDAMFADLAKLKLKEAGIDVWLDHGALRPGEEWRQAIDEGISSSDVLLVVVTPRSCASPYVTYEWAYALGKGIKVIPLLLEKAENHPRLSGVQHLDFQDFRSGPWDELCGEIGGGGGNAPTDRTPPADQYRVARDRIFDYLDRNTIQMVSFEKIQDNIDPTYDEKFLFELIRRHHEELRSAKLSGNRQGVARKA